IKHQNHPHPSPAEKEGKSEGLACLSSPYLDTADLRRQRALLACTHKKTTDIYVVVIRAI
ncbi:MAG: hypothetical protein ABFD66_09475, partial [Smithella sp.]